MQQRLVASHKFDLSKYNVLFGEVLIYSAGYNYYIFEVGFGASSLLSKHVTIEPGSMCTIETRFKSPGGTFLYLIKPSKRKLGSISLKQCSFPTQEEYNTYREIKVGI